MTDAQHAAHEQAKKKNDHIKGRILSIVKDNPGVTYRGIMREYQRRHRQPLAQATAGGRVADLAAEGLIYAQGSTVEDGSTLSMYYYEPDPSCRFRIKVERENEKFLRWLRNCVTPEIGLAIYQAAQNIHQANRMETGTLFQES